MFRIKQTTVHSLAICWGTKKGATIYCRTYQEMVFKSLFKLRNL